MERWMAAAGKMLTEWKGDSYTFGFDVLEKAGEQAGKFGKRALLIAAELGEPWVSGFSEDQQGFFEQRRGWNSKPSPEPARTRPGKICTGWPCTLPAPAPT